MAVLYSKTEDSYVKMIFPTPTTTKQCFLCLEIVEPPCIWWSGDSLIFLHFDCARLLASHLQSDAMRYLVSFDIKRIK